MSRCCDDRWNPPDLSRSTSPAHVNRSTSRGDALSLPLGTSARDEFARSLRHQLRKRSDPTIAKRSEQARWASSKNLEELTDSQAPPRWVRSPASVTRAASSSAQARHTVPPFRRTAGPASGRLDDLDDSVGPVPHGELPTPLGTRTLTPHGAGRPTPSLGTCTDCRGGVPDVLRSASTMPMLLSG